MRETAERKGLTIGSAATHPFAKWEDQRIVERERYREILDALGFVVRQELLFGLHVHVGIDDPEKAIHVANGMRVHLADPARAVDQLAVLARQADRADVRAHADLPAAATRRRAAALRRAGATTAARIEFMVEAGAVPDYTFLWWDVRPHPNLGTVEIRSCDAQTRLEHTVALAALIQAMCKELSEHYEAGYELGTFPAGAARGEQVARRPLRHRRRADRPAARATRVPGARARPAAGRAPPARTRGSWAPSASSSG